MNFLEATNADILKVSRKNQFEELLAAIETVSDYGYDFGEFSENKAVELILAGENLTLDDVEIFAKYHSDNDGNCCMYYSNELFNLVFEEIWGEDEYYTFEKHKYKAFESGNIHQLQYDNYKYVGKHA